MSFGAVSGIGGGYNFPPITEVREKMFSRMDQDGDGVITKSEFLAAAPDQARKNGRALDAEEIFARIDANQDGVIDQSEQEAALEGMKPPPPAPPPGMLGDLSELLEKIFTALDTNQDGVVDRSEYEAALEQLGNRTESEGATAAATDNSTATVISPGAASTATASTEDNSLGSLVAQFLDLLAMMERSYHSQPFQESRNPLSVNSYA